jgi:hypothetical protein
MNYKKMSKKELIKQIKSLESSIDYLYTEPQLDERYDQGFDNGYNEGIGKVSQELSDYELKQYGDNILRIS